MDPTGHDVALSALFDAMQGGLDECGLAAWVNALRGWHAVTSDEDYWFLALIHEDEGVLSAAPRQRRSKRYEPMPFASLPSR